MKKNLLQRFFATLMLLAITTLTWAYDFEANGIYYNKNSDGTSVTVTYKTTSDRGYSGSVVIPSTVTYNDTEYSVTSIGNYAFLECSGLTSVTIPNSVTSIGAGAFYDCSGLTSVTIPNSVTSIGGYAFSGTAWYNNQPDGLVYAGKVAYKYKGTMPSGTHITLEEGTLGIAVSAFSGCSGLTSIDIPNSVTRIGGSAFYGCSGLTSVTIPNSVTSIENNTFYYCDGLTSVTIPNSVTSIDKYAFCNCSSLTSVTIGYGVTSIGQKCFYGCSSLKSIILNANEIVSKTSSNSNLRTIFGSQVTEYILGNDVKSIGDYAFADCSSLTSVTIGKNVTSIGKNAFDLCNSLTSVNITDIAAWCNILFNDEDHWTNVRIAGSNPLCYAHHLFVNAKEVTDLVIPDKVTRISDRAFIGCTGITSITIPNSVTTIGAVAFSTCSGLTNVIIPNSVTTIGEDAFSNCTSLSNITIPESVTAIGNYAFYGCIGLTSVVIPNSVTSIGEQLFYNCSSLTSINIPNSVTSIGGYAFYNCSSLTSVSIPESVTSIGNYAFRNCSGLTSVYCLAEQLPVTDQYTFYSYDSYTKNATLYVPESALDNYKTTVPWSSFGTILAIKDDPTYIKGDANGNGVVEIGDVTSVLTLMATPEAIGYDKKAADANGNGEIEIGDVTTILTIMAGN